jgi:putative spermidine/putrescine transport system permease protein
MKTIRFNVFMALPLAVFTLAFLILPLSRLALTSVAGERGFGAYAEIVTNARYVHSFVNTVGLALLTTATTLVVSTIVAQTLANRVFPGRGVLLSLLTFPLAFPGVVVGFMVILLGGRLGVVGGFWRATFGGNLVFAYSYAGLLLGYVYFSVPRVLLTVLAAAEKLDPALVEAARSLGAGPFAIQRDVVLPALFPAMYTSSALCFATAMGAFGTAFTLATHFDVTPLLIYSEFTMATDAGMAAALSIVLGLVTWAALALARLGARQAGRGA